MGALARQYRFQRFTLFTDEIKKGRDARGASQIGVRQQAPDARQFGYRPQQA